MRKMLTLFILLVILMVGCAQKQEYGAVKGTITWQYNNFVGTRPDVGAEIFLFPEIPVIKMTDDEASSFFLVIKAPEGYYCVEVNGEGKYDIQAIKTGKYRCIIVSKKTNGLLYDGYIKSTVNYLTKYISEDRAKYFEKGVLGANKFTTKDIEIKPGITIDVSHDFGNTFI